MACAGGGRLLTRSSDIAEVGARAVPCRLSVQCAMLACWCIQSKKDRPLCSRPLQILAASSCVPSPTPCRPAPKSSAPGELACAHAVALPSTKRHIRRVGPQASQECRAEAAFDAVHCRDATGDAGHVRWWNRAVGAAGSRRRGRSLSMRGLAAAVRAAGCRCSCCASRLLPRQLQPALGAEGGGIGSPHSRVSVQQVGADQHRGACRKEEAPG